MSEYLRRCSLNKRIHSHVSDKAVARLSSLCGLQKHLLMQITVFHRKAHFAVN